MAGAGGLPAPCADFFDTISARLGGSLGVRDGGKITGKPDSCGDDDVVTGLVLVAVVEVEAGTAIGRRKTPSEPLTELGGVVVCDELSSEGRGDRKDAERRRSLSGLAGGGGMLMLGVSIVAFV
jgi:hypothetical protein